VSRRLTATTNTRAFVANPKPASPRPVYTPSLLASQLMRMKHDFAKRENKAKQQDTKYREMPDIVVKVICRYRAELFFKISRKTKLSRLINSWTERMERNGTGPVANAKEENGDVKENGTAKHDAATTHYSGATPGSGMQFIFTFNGRMLEADQTPEEIGIDEGDEIVAVELMDLTEGGGGSEEWVRSPTLFFSAQPR
jgi:hypothetical protein